MNYTHIPIIFLIFLSTTTFATVGGKQTLQFLGYDQAAQKLYLLRHYEDESGRLPQLYYYHLKTYTSKRSKIQPQLIEVKSLYINPKNQKIDNNQDDTHFFKELDKIQNRLQPLKAEKSAQAQLSIQQQSLTGIPNPYNPEIQISKYTYHYRVVSHSYKSALQQATSYKNDLMIKQFFSIPKQKYKIATTQYLAFPEETGYSTEDSILLSE